MSREPEGFAQFVEARERALQRTAWLLTGDRGLAEDLVQSALVRTWPRWQRIRRHDDPEVYVRRVMVNTWATWTRRRWRGEHATESVPEDPAPGDIATEVAVRVAIRSALASLTARQRACSYCACSTTCLRRKLLRFSTVLSAPLRARCRRPWQSCAATLA